MTAKTRDESLSYADAGVSIERGDALVDRIKADVKSTRRSGADGTIGGFGGMFDLKAAGFSDPVLVSGTDGVGTKLRIAIDTGAVDTVGIDLVAMCANDVLAQGAEPLFFLDYYACGHLDVDVAAKVVSGIAEGCRQAGCALIGGETAEMPGMYEGADFDLAGFVVGAVERDAILPRLEAMEAGDVLIGLPSSGPHSNGYSLIRKVVAKAGLGWDDPAPFAEAAHSGVSVAEALLTPTRLYIKPALPLIREGLVKGLAHITGGGLTENIPRMLPDQLGFEIDYAAWERPAVFKWLQESGNIDEAEMRRAFNCGIGLVIAVAAADADIALARLRDLGEAPVRLGELVTA